MRTIVSSSAPFESRIGFSRAVRVCHVVAVAGTAPIALDGAVASPGSVYVQTRPCQDVVCKLSRRLA